MNRLLRVVVSGQTTSFTYYVGGNRMKTTKPDGTITDTPFPGSEVENSTGTARNRRPYSLARQAIATRMSGDLVSGNNDRIFIYSDHASANSAQAWAMCV